jgi:serine/threonine protein kinase
MIEEIISHYKILEKVGEGGMGVVFKAQDTRLDRIVALKFLPPHITQDEEARARFIREAKAAAALDHPGICTVYEVDEAKDQIFIAMAYIAGENLKKKIESGKLDLEEAIDIAIQIAEGLKEAHRIGIIHRDIKPANIMLTEKGQVKITDFGLAKLESGVDLTRTATIMGTAAYMSPEQARGEKADQRSDIWSLGVVAYEMLAGRLPHGGTYEQMMYALFHEEPKPLSQIKPQITKELDKAVMKSLRKNLEDRYSDMDGFLSALKKVRDTFKRRDHQEEGSEAHIPSIAVLPFMDMSPQKDQEYFCDGMAEEIINALTHIKELRVVARTSAFAFKGKDRDVREIGGILNVDTILEGSLRKAGDRLRITAQLINVADGYHLWSERFDRKLEDVFAIQDEISLAVVDRLKVEILRGEKEKVVKRHTQDPEAHNMYLRGRYFLNKWTQEGVQKGLAYFQEAIKKDPQFTPAYLAAAETYAHMGILSLAAPKQIFPIAKEWLAKAVTVEPGSEEANFVSALIAFWFDWNWGKAEDLFGDSISHNPGNAAAHSWYAWHLAALKRFGEASEEIRQALTLDPMMPFFHASAVGIYGYSGEYERAQAEFEKAIEMDPSNGLAYFHMGGVCRIQKKPEKAIELFKKAIEFSTGLAWAEGSLGGVYGMIGERGKAEQILHRLLAQREHQYVSAICIASLYSHMKDKEKAFEWLEKAFQEQDNLIPLINILRLFETLEDEPRYQSFLKKLGFAS